MLLEGARSYIRPPISEAVKEVPANDTNMGLFIRVIRVIRWLIPPSSESLAHNSLRFLQ